jgi:UDP-galactose transporter B1
VPVSVPFQSVTEGTFDKFRSALFISTCQSALSCLSALAYILVRRNPEETLFQCLGIHTSDNKVPNGKALANGVANHQNKAASLHSNNSTRSLLLRYFQCSVFITCAAPLGFASLSYISYPAMVLGKSCKLVPVMIMNLLLYRRRFAPHKYLVVFMVTIGITIFMGFGAEKPPKDRRSKEHSTVYSNLVGIVYLLSNLALDGATNSTQDEIFSCYRVTGQQMMFWINVFCTVQSSILSVLPLPHIPVIHPSESGRMELDVALRFIRSHPSVLVPLAQFAFTGALGQLFIFETLQHFGSLTLVYVPYFSSKEITLIKHI